MKAHRVIQGSAEWFDLKCGKVTSSRVADAIAVLKKKEGEAACRRHLRTKIVSEILTGRHSESYVSAAMEHGTEFEPIARTEYEMRTGNDVRLVGFVEHPSIERAGWSPDGVIGKDGCLEIKCPQSNTHIDYLIAGVVPEEYQPQCLWGMACGELDWCDFVSFDPRMPNKHKMMKVRMYRDDKRIYAMQAEVLKFLAEVDEVIARLSAGEDYLTQQLEASVAQFGITPSEAEAAVKGQL